jgi:hypothetical protein
MESEKVQRSSNESRSQSYEFGIYNNNAGVVVGWSIFKLQKKISVSSKRTRFLVAM